MIYDSQCGEPPYKGRAKGADFEVFCREIPTRIIFNREFLPSQVSNYSHLIQHAADKILSRV